MKNITAFELDGHLASANAHVYMLYGSQGILITECADKIEKKYMPDIPDFNYAKLDGSQCTLDVLEAQLDQLPQFAENRLVTVCDLPITSLSEKELARLCAAIGSVGSDCVLILRFLNIGVSFSGKDASAGRWKKLTAAVSANGICVVCDSPDRKELGGILVKRAQESGVKLKSGDAAKLINLTGTDFSILASQLDMLCAVAPRRMITAELIDRLIEPGTETNIFNLTKCILAGNFDGAYDILEKLYLQRLDPSAILRVMQGPFIDLYRAKSGIQAKMSVDQIAEIYPSDYPKNKRFLLENAMRDCSRYSFALLRRYVILIADTAVKMHGSRIDAAVLLEQLIARLCQVRTEEGRR